MQHGDRIERQPHARGIFVVAVRERLSLDVLNGSQVLNDLVFPLFPARVHGCRKQSPQNPFQDVLPLEALRLEEPPGWVVVSGPEVFKASLEERFAFFAGQSRVIRSLTGGETTRQQNAPRQGRWCMPFEDGIVSAGKRTRRMQPLKMRK